LGICSIKGNHAQGSLIMALIHSSHVQGTGNVEIIMPIEEKTRKIKK